MRFLTAGGDTETGFEESISAFKMVNLEELILFLGLNRPV